MDLGLIKRSFIIINSKNLVEAGNKTINWVTEQLNLDGTFSGIERHILAYYKAPMTFAEAGRVTEAKAIAQHLRNTFFRMEIFMQLKMILRLVA